MRRSNPFVGVARALSALPTRELVTLAFCGFLCLILLATYLVSGLPSPQQVCTKKCAEINKKGELVYNGPATPKDAYKELNSVCECRQ